MGRVPKALLSLWADWLLLSNPRESKIDSGGRLEDGSVEGGTGDTRKEERCRDWRVDSGGRTCLGVLIALCIGHGSGGTTEPLDS